MRCCANDSGRSPSRGTVGIGGVTARDGSAWMRSESRTSVGASNSARRGRSTPNRAPTRVTSCVASSEWPPRSKKSSCAPTRSTRSTSRNRDASCSWSGVRGASSSREDVAAVGAGSSRRSTFPLVVRGRASRPTKAAGTMYSGSRARRCSRRALASTVAGTTYATRR
ncbi:hypothetical protein COSO111634_27200 [Corallococcus soli]